MKTKCKHYYLYYNDQEFGLMFLKVQTWFPYNVQIYINGREYLSKIFDRNNIKYEMYNHSFSYVEDFEKAQKLADGILNEKLGSSFDGIIRKVNNLLPDIERVYGRSYYWCIDQCEFATDINFKSRQELEDIYRTLVETAFFTFSSQDIYSFFGRRVDRIHTFRKGEIISDLRNRYQGYRIKFKINDNQIKMYDKGNNLRIEVTINNPSDFKVLKDIEGSIGESGEAASKKEWKPMGKGIVNLYRYAEISKSILSRYMKALPEIDIHRIPLNEMTKISSRKEVGGRRYSGINILSEETLHIFVAIASGEYIINGFNNKQLRKRIYASSGKDTKQSVNKTTRILSKLKGHGIIKKVSRRNKYYLTSRGRRIVNSALLYTNKTLLNTV